MANIVSHEEQVGQQLAKDRQAQTRRQWTVLSKGGWISESKVKGKPITPSSPSQIMTSKDND